MTANKPTDQELASMSGWDIAKALGCEYSGDCNPIRHGGFFYDARDWEAWGYANIVEFWDDPETKDDILVVQRGTIHKPDDMSGAFRCCDVPESEQGNIHAQIEACRYYGGIETDDEDRLQPRRYNLDNWKEWRIWKSIRPLIEQLGK